MGALCWPPTASSGGQGLAGNGGVTLVMNCVRLPPQPADLELSTLYFWACGDRSWVCWSTGSAEARGIVISAFGSAVTAVLFALPVPAGQHAQLYRWASGGLVPVDGDAGRRHAVVTLRLAPAVRQARASSSLAMMLQCVSSSVWEDPQT